jgi:hypothetical protein
MAEKEGVKFELGFFGIRENDITAIKEKVKDYPYLSSGVLRITDNQPLDYDPKKPSATAGRLQKALIAVGFRDVRIYCALRSPLDFLYGADVVIFCDSRFLTADLKLFSYKEENIKADMVITSQDTARLDLSELARTIKKKLEEHDRKWPR